jgi:hypothetical protein
MGALLAGTENLGGNQSLTMCTKMKMNSWTIGARNEFLAGATE